MTKYDSELPMTKYDSELPILLCQVVLNFVLEVLKKSGILFHLYCINPAFNKVNNVYAYLVHSHL